jgi:hypothetical protein
LLDPILKNIMQGITLIEDDYGVVNRIISKQLGDYALTNGKKVCFLEPPGVAGGSVLLQGNGEDYNGFEIPAEQTVENNSGGAQKNTVIYRTEERYLPLEQLKFDMIVFDSFSSYIFGVSEKEVVDLMQEIVRLSKQGKSFVLTCEAPLLSERVIAYIRATVDSLIIARAEIAQNKINRTLYIPKMIGMTPLDHVVKITVEDDGVNIDTREFVG